MNKLFDKFLPYLMILLGLFTVYTGDIIPGGVGIILGIFMFEINLMRYLPFLLILLGLFLLGFMGLIYPAAACIIFGVLMLLEKIWPEAKKSE